MKKGHFDSVRAEVVKGVMREERMLNQELSEYRHEHVRPIMLEFEAAAGRDAVSRSLSRKSTCAL
jgi:hypothetical protein